MSSIVTGAIVPMAGQGSTGKAEFDFWRGCCHAVTMNELRVTLTGKLVGAQELLNEPFSDECRPTLRYCGRQGSGFSSESSALIIVAIFDALGGTILQRRRDVYKFKSEKRIYRVKCGVTKLGAGSTPAASTIFYFRRR